MQSIMALDQYGHTYHDLGNAPRKALLEKLGSSHAEKMYMDNDQGETKHVGYIIGGLWLTLYKVTPWEK